MAYRDMTAKVRGSVPKLPIIAAKSFVDDAWQDIRKKNLWSFQLFTDQWISPAMVTSGQATTTIGSPTVTLDATATAALVASQLASPYSLITQRQFRGSNAGGIYSIYGWDYPATSPTSI